MPAFSRPFRNLETDEPLKKAHLLREIAARTNIKESIVDEVLSTFREVATEEIVNKGKFNFFGLFSVDNSFIKAIRTGLGHEVPARQRLRTKLSDRVKKLWNAKQKSGDAQKLSFMELMDLYANSEVNDVRSSIGLLPSAGTATQITGNPLLDDDDEY